MKLMYSDGAQNSSDVPFMILGCFFFFLLRRAACIGDDDPMSSCTCSTSF